MDHTLREPSPVGGPAPGPCRVLPPRAGAAAYRLPGTRRAPDDSRVGGRRRRTVQLCAGLAGVALLGPVVGCGGPDRLEGTVRAVDDTGKHPEALAGGWLAVLTADQAMAFLAGAGADPPSPADLPYVSVRVRHEEVTALGGSLSPIDAHGEFTTGLTGARYLCLLREVPQQADLLRGCAQLTLPRAGRLEVTVGEGGMRAVLDD